MRERTDDLADEERLEFLGTLVVLFGGGATDVETGNVRDELIELALQLLRDHLGDAGRAAFRIMLEADRIPGVAEHWDSIRESQVLAARAIVRRAIESGELPEGTR